MHYRKLGQTDIEVSTIAMGCWAIVGGMVWGDQDEADALAALRRSYELGVNFFDTAPGYGGGASEQLLGRALGDVRDRIVIATKVGPDDLRPANLIGSVEQSLTDLGTDYIDLLQVHWPNWSVPIEQTLGAMQQLVDQGKLRAIGVSNFGPADLTAALDVTPIAVDQVCYNLLYRAIEYAVQPICVDRGVSLLCYLPMFQGLLLGKFANADDVPEGRARTRHFASERELTRHGEDGCEDLTFETIGKVLAVAERLDAPPSHVALAWCAARPAVASVLAGARNPQQAEQNVAAAELVLDDDTLAELDAATAPLKTALGPELDAWKSPGHSRIR